MSHLLEYFSYHRMILFTQRRKYIYKGQKQTKSDKKGHQRPNAVTFPLSIIIWLCKIHYILKFLIYICLVRHSEIYYFQKPPQKSKVANFYKNIEIVRCERPNKRLKTAIHGSRYDSNGVSMQQQVIYKVSDVRINDEINEQRFLKKIGRVRFQLLRRRLVLTNRNDGCPYPTQPHPILSGACPSDLGSR